jgi:hypothetical protein
LNTKVDSALVQITDLNKQFKSLHQMVKSIHDLNLDQKKEVQFLSKNLNKDDVIRYERAPKKWEPYKFK